MEKQDSNTHDLNKRPWIDETFFNKTLRDINEEGIDIVDFKDQTPVAPIRMNSILDMNRLVSTKVIWTSINYAGDLNYSFEVIGFNKEWIDPDFNPEGTRVCFKSDAGEKGWCSAKWIDCKDAYFTDYETAPTHFLKIPSTNILL